MNIGAYEWTLIFLLVSFLIFSFWKIRDINKWDAQPKYKIKQYESDFRIFEKTREPWEWTMVIVYGGSRFNSYEEALVKMRELIEQDKQYDIANWKDV